MEGLNGGRAAVIFDLDGTLIDSAAGIAAAVNRMLAGEDRAPMSVAEVQICVGNGLPALVARVCAARGLASARQPALAAVLSADYAAHPAEAGQVYPHVPAALAALRDAGHPMAICTNKPARPARAVLKVTGLAPFFAAVVGGDTLAARKPDPEPLLTAWRALGADRAIYVGDSGVDAATATAAALPFVLFTEGYLNAPRETVRETAAFSDFRRLPGLISRLDPRA